MTWQERWAAVERLLDQALELTPEERPGFLGRACAGDLELLAEVERLMRAAGDAQAFLAEPAPAFAAPLLARLAQCSALAPGARLGDYEVVRELGRGGMATVYLAQDLKLPRRVAIKVLSPELALAVRTDRFLREIEIAAKLTHPHILPVHDSGSAVGELYYVTPYIEGKSLRERLSGGPLPLEEALRIVAEVASALDYAHRHGVVHRDIKPANILFADGQAVVADFGIARVLTAAETETITEAGVSLGTPAYMSPEQAGGSGELDGRSDIYSLGCVLYEMLTGGPPFVGRDAQAVLAKHLTEAVPLVKAQRAEVPAAVEEALTRALAKQPRERFNTASEFASALSGAGTGFPARGSRPAPLYAGLGVATLLAGYMVIRYLVAPPGPCAPRTVAVLPFDNLSGDTASEYFSDGMTEGLIDALAQVPGLQVPARTSAFVFKGRTADIREIGRRLNVACVLEGSVRGSGTPLRVSANLIKVADGRILWSATYDRELHDGNDVFAVQDGIARAIAQALQVKLAPVAPASRTEDLEAYNLYQKGRLLWNRENQPEEELNRALGYFNAAIAKDSGYARAYVGRADVYERLLFLRYLPRAEAYPKARAAVERAIALDPQLAEAYASRGLIRYRYAYDWAGAAGDFRRAVELNPGYALAHAWYGYVLTQHEDRAAEAIREARRAAELDPLSPEVLNGYSFMLFNARQYPASEELARELLDLEPSARGHQRLAEAYLFQGKVDEAIQEFQTTLSFLRGRGRRGVILARIGFAYARGGRRAQALRILRDLKRDMASGDAGLIGIEFHLAILCAGLGDEDQAFTWLERAFHERDFALNSLATSPFFDSLRPDPRFQQLLKRLGGDA